MVRSLGKIVSILFLTAGLVLGTSYSPAAGKADQAKEKTVQTDSENPGAPVDLAIANDERLIKMLKEKGTIPKNATADEQEKILQQYLEKLAKRNEAVKNQTNGTMAKKSEALKEKIKDKVKKKGMKASKYHSKSNKVAAFQPEKWTGGTRKDDVLVLLIDFPDLPHGKISKDDTDMYYSGSDAYSHQHYQDMIFGDNGYTGPDGKTKLSMKQYYEQQSGGSYTIDGTVAGWYTASHPAAYYGAHSATDGNDANPRDLVKEALAKAAQDSSVDLSKYDQEDTYDLDGDNNKREPDGIIDHLMVIHSGVGEEAGGGSLGENAIWSHSWSLASPYNIPNTKTEVPYWGGNLAGFDYTIEPEDGAAGVFAHEFGHDLGLPDEYDTLYSGSGEPISFWSIMSSGSWAGAIPGTEPSGFSPYDKAYLQASMTTDGFTPNWQTGTEVDFNEITSTGKTYLLDEASSKGTNNDAVKVKLPDKVTEINKPASGNHEYFSGSGNDLSTAMTKTIDLSAVSSAQLTFKAWYSIEQDYDYASIKVNGKSIPGNITTTSNPNEANPGNGITGESNGWVDASFDLSRYAGQKITLSFNYDTDPGVAQAGFFADDIKVSGDHNLLLSDNAEGDPAFDFDGFSLSDGTKKTAQYYLLEWRTQNGTDAGLAHVNRRGTMISYDPGLLVWYVDESYDNNWTGPGYHPGEGFLGIVDADQHNNIWHDRTGETCGASRCLASNSYQMHDAAFSLDKGKVVRIGDRASSYLIDNHRKKSLLFDDAKDYSNPENPDVGRKVPKLGLKVKLKADSKDGRVGEILLYK